MKCPYCAGSGTIADKDVHVGQLVLAARLKSGITQAELAAQAGISRGQIANLETGRTDASIQLLKRVAAALSVSMKDLVP